MKTSKTEKNDVNFFGRDFTEVKASKTEKKYVNIVSGGISPVVKTSKAEKERM